MKKLLSLWIAVLVTFGGMIGVNAYSYTDDYYYADEITVTLNGSKIYFDQPPIMQNDRTLVPMRKIFEAMGCNVEWDEESQMIDVWSGDENIMTLWVDYESMWTPEAYIELDVPPIVVNDRTLVPVRAISESIGALVDWDDYTQTVIITYNQKNSSSAVNFDSATDNICTHKNVGENCSIDERVYTNTGSDASHTIADAMNTYCKDCGEILSEYTREWEAGHDFEGSVCIDCGYVKKYSGDSEKSDETNYLDNEDDYDNDRNNTESKPSKPSSSGSVTDYIDGAFLHIAVPAGKSIEVPNTSNGTLKIQVDGVYNVMERKADGKINAAGYNAKSKKVSFNISKAAKAIVQNSGDSDLIVSVPAEFASYTESYESVYETYYVSRGESIVIEPNNDQRATIYFSNRNFDYMKYDYKRSVLNATFLNGKIYSTNSTIYPSESVRITAASDLEVSYCTALLSVSSSVSVFTERTINVGQTIRVYAPDNSKTNIYVEEGYIYDYVCYNSNGSVSSQKQNKKGNSTGTTLNKGNYIDITNTSTDLFTLKIPNGYGYIE